MPAVSKAQQAAAAIALHGNPKSGTPAAQMKKSMSGTELDKFASTKSKKLPAKVKESFPITFKQYLLKEFIDLGIWKEIVAELEHDLARYDGDYSEWSKVVLKSPSARMEELLEQIPPEFMREYNERIQNQLRKMADLALAEGAFDDDDDDEPQFSNGNTVVLKDSPSEKFKVSQNDPEKRKCWIGDKQGRGWYVRYSQIRKA